VSEPDKTLTEFLAQKRISKAFYYGLKKRGLGANETTYPGSRVIRISAAAEQAFDERIAEYAKSEAAKLEAERRSAQAAAAARLAVQSPRHVSKRYQQPPPKLRRQRRALADRPAADKHETIEARKETPAAREAAGENSSHVSGVGSPLASRTPRQQ
jgi:hypothetical protein